ncbi:MAG: alpha-amylase family glycosyl hydrolase [Bacteroidales bacterium]|jgi:glycosidase
MKAFYFYLIFITMAASLTYSCKNKTRVPETKTEYRKIMPEWAKDAVIYEVNIRQHTPDGTFKSFIKDIPRLKEMGIDILWIMPIQEIGELNRKGELGSYYSIKDYRKVNPEYGSFEDFKQLVKTAHENNMYVILDWVANHTAWDHYWTKYKPEFYSKDKNGNFIPPVEDWEDVIDLNYDNHELWDSMIGAMKYWLIEANIDGFRCDVAEMVPTEFWNEARKQLDQIKPVFMLAEAEKPEHHEKAFDMSYSWWLLHGMNQIAKGEKPVTELDTILIWEAENFPPGSVRMRFTTNHDENSWNGTEFERYGDGHLTFSVLCFTLPGMPLLYSGQEAAMNKRLRFFDKDTVDWGDYKYQEFYKNLIKLKKRNQALWNGEYGGTMEILHSYPDSPVFAFKRVKGENEVVVILNLSDKPASLSMNMLDKTNVYYEYFRLDDYDFKSLENLKLNPWDYFILIKK